MFMLLSEPPTSMVCTGCRTIFSTAEEPFWAVAFLDKNAVNRITQAVTTFLIDFAIDFTYDFTNLRLGIWLTAWSRNSRGELPVCFLKKLLKLLSSEKPRS